MATQPVLGGVTLAHPTAYEADQVLQGSVQEMADGTIVVDVVNPGLIGIYRPVYKLTWTNITSANATTIENQYWAMVNAGSASFTTPEGAIVNVMPTKDIKLDRKAVKTFGGTLRYSVTIEMKRIS